MNVIGVFLGILLLGILSANATPCSDVSDCAEGLLCTVNNGRDGLASGVCVDCEGIEDGTSRYDRCDVCGGTDECVGCDGIAFSGIFDDACGVCGGDGSTCSGCDGVPNSGVMEDECGVCGGDGSSCAGCDGIPNSGARLDTCGECNGHNACCRDAHGRICSDHGACDGSITSYTKCACDVGWTGPLCDLEQYYCTDAAGEYSMVDCGPHGTCSEQLKGGCMCDPGFFGPRCDIRMCGAHAVWKPSAGRCVCREGFKGEHCDQCSTPSDLSGVKDVVDRMTKDTGVQNNMIVSKKEKVLERMSYVCVSPSVYDQHYYDAMKIVNPNTYGAAKVEEGMKVHAKLVNYELVSFPHDDVDLLLKGRHPFSQKTPHDELPMRPNSTRNGIYYDCACYAWTVESVDGLQPSEEDIPFIQARAAQKHISYRHHNHALAQRGAFINHHIVRASNASVNNLTVANMLLNDCLDALSVEATSEDTPAQIGKLIQDGIDGINFDNDFCVGWWVASVTTIMVAFFIGVVIFLFFNYTLGFGSDPKANPLDAFDSDPKANPPDTFDSNVIYVEPFE